MKEKYRVFLNSKIGFRSFFKVNFLVVTGLMMFISCQEDNKKKSIPKNADVATEVMAVEEEQEKQKQKQKEEQLIVTYHIDSIESNTAVDTFDIRYNKVAQNHIFALNRMDARRLDPGDRIIIPDTLVEDWMIYSPFPKKLNILDSIPKTVLISRRIQAFALYENDKLIRWGPVSSGKRSTPTPVGLHYGNYKAERKVSTVNPAWLLPYYFNFMNFEGVGTHQYALPGYPASHACVRLREQDARFIFDWAKQWKLNDNGQVVLKNGTPFMVYGEYDYEAIPSWLHLAKNRLSNFMTEKELQIIQQYVLEYFEDERNFEQKEIELSPDSTDALSFSSEKNNSGS